MTTVLDKTLKREIQVDGRAFVVSLSPEGLKLTKKGMRRGQELLWKDIVSGDAALAIALNASLGRAGAAATAPVAAKARGRANAGASAKAPPAGKRRATEKTARR